MRRKNKYPKKTLDFLLSLLFILLTFPLQVVIFFILLFELREFPIFIQKRGISTRKLFYIIKFKTIPSNVSFKHKNIFYKKEYGKFIGKFSSFLRRSGLDELPQLFNVLTGSMSLIGPRPLMLDDLIIMKKYHPREYGKRVNLRLKPGLSGMWQLFGDRSKGVENLLELDTKYAREKSFLTDMKLLGYTIWTVLLRKHSDAIIDAYAKVEELKAEKPLKEKLPLLNTLVSE